MDDTTTQLLKRQVDDHSKRLFKLEESSRLAESQRSALLMSMQRIKEVLWGSDNPREISIKDQLRETNGLLISLTNEIRESQKDTNRIREEGFQRIGKLEQWKEEIIVPHLQESEERQKELRKDWKSIGLDVLRWLVLFALATAVAKFA